MIDNVSSGFTPQTHTLGSYLTPRASLAAILALGALSALIYFLQRKPPVTPQTPASIPQRLLNDQQPKFVSLHPYALGHSKKIFELISSILTHQPRAGG